jgi:hypothetical protein
MRRATPKKEPIAGLAAKVGGCLEAIRCIWFAANDAQHDAPKHDISANNAPIVCGEGGSHPSSRRCVHRAASASQPVYQRINEEATPDEGEQTMSPTWTERWRPQ